MGKQHIEIFIVKIKSKSNNLLIDIIVIDF